MDIFHFEIAVRSLSGAHEEIHTACVAVSDLGLDGVIACKFGEPTGTQGFGHDPVGVGGVYAHNTGRKLNEVEIPSQFALRVAGIRKPHLEPGHIQAGHRTRIGAMRRDNIARVERDIGQETLVAADKRAANHRLG